MPRPISFAAIIPLGPSDYEIERTQDLLDSLFYYEPDVALIVFIDDAAADRHLAGRFRVPPGARLVSVWNDRRGRGIGPTSGLAAGMLLALRRLHDERDGAFSFVVKLDTDALVIAPFAERLGARLAARPLAGMAGLFETNCDGTTRDFLKFGKMARKLAAPAAVWRSPVSRWSFFTLHLWGARAAVRRQICGALARGYRAGEFILGGAYAVTGEAVRRMAEAGFFAEPRIWLGTHFSEDAVLSMQVRAVGLELLGMAEDIFGEQQIGLPDTPERLLARGYGIIHSVKGDERFSEKEIRRFFRERRESAGTAPPAQAGDAA